MDVRSAAQLAYYHLVSSETIGLDPDQIGLGQVANPDKKPTLYVVEGSQRRERSSTGYADEIEQDIEIICLGDDRSKIESICRRAAEIAIEGLEQNAENGDTCILGVIGIDDAKTETVPVKEDDELSKIYPNRSRIVFSLYCEPARKGE